MNKDKIASFASSNRSFISNLVFLLILFFLLFTTHSWESKLVRMAFELGGFIFVVIGALGRIWTGIYIYGYKDDNLITTGAYSIVRNPLYFFSFFGALGVGLASKNLIVLAVILIFFLLYYPWVVIAEEKKLKDLFPKQYGEYKKKVDRFIPSLTLFHEPEYYKFKPKSYRNMFSDVIWFFWIYLMLRVLELVHHLELLPILFEIP